MIKTARSPFTSCKAPVFQIRAVAERVLMAIGCYKSYEEELPWKPGGFLSVICIGLGKFLASCVRRHLRSRLNGV